MPKNCRSCQIELNEENCPPSFLARGFTICRNCNQQQSNKRTREYRLEVISKLGNECQCCGISIIELLSIDHIHGGGHQESKIRRGKGFIKKLYYMPLEELLSKYQCLCFNCNYAKGFWGSCPHTLKNDIDTSSLLVGDRSISQTHLPIDEHKERELQLRQINRLKNRLEVVLAYGSECMQCQETQPLFLTLDHIHNNGSLEICRGNDFYQFLKRLGYPGKDTQLQLLCHNCNATKEYQNNRAHKSETIKTEAEIYAPQPYSISEDMEEQLWHQARCLFYRLRNS